MSDVALPEVGSIWRPAKGRKSRRVVSTGSPSPKAIWFVSDGVGSQRHCYISDWQLWVARTGAAPEQNIGSAAP
jgi:hypothetical protein